MTTGAGPDWRCRPFHQDTGPILIARTRSGARPVTHMRGRAARIDHPGEEAVALATAGGAHGAGGEIAQRPRPVG